MAPEDHQDAHQSSDEEGCAGFQEEREDVPLFFAGHAGAMRNSGGAVFSEAGLRRGAETHVGESRGKREFDGRRHRVRCENP